MTMTQKTRPCPRCGRNLPADATGDSCPRCLLAAGLDSADGSAGAADLEAVAALFPGLELLELRGQGGMGLVYKARQRKLDRIVALKVLLPEVAAEAGFADRFLREARTMARLQHPHIVGVYEFGEADGLYYLIMEYVDGPNLRQVLNAGDLKAKEALAIVPQVCDALQYAHEQGVVHRDIKPENILLDRLGRVKIADFGLAKLLQSAARDHTLTRAGQVMGTVHYMAPEQYQTPNTVDHRADIYSLGVVFYEMLTGQLPLGRFDPPSQRVQVDVRLDQVVLRALEQERDRRYQRVSEVREQVDSIATTPAPRVAAPVAAADGPRTSRLAVWSFVLLPIGLITMVLSALLMPLASSEDGPQRPLVEFLAATLIMGPPVLSFLFAVVSLFRIPFSNGRLKGLPWAICSLLLGGLMTLFMVSWLLIGEARVEGPEGATISTPMDGEAGLPVVQEEGLSLPAVQTWTIATAVRQRFEELRERHGSSIGTLGYEDMRDLYSPADRTRLDAMLDSQRDPAGLQGDLGLPLSLLHSPAEPFQSHKAKAVHMKEPGRARLLLAGWSTETYVPMVQDEDGTWYFAAEPLTRAGEDPGR